MYSTQASASTSTFYRTTTKNEMKKKIATSTICEHTLRIIFFTHAVLSNLLHHHAQAHPTPCYHCTLIRAIFWSHSVLSSFYDVDSKEENEKNTGQKTKKRLMLSILIRLVGIGRNYPLIIPGFLKSPKKCE